MGTTDKTSQRAFAVLATTAILAGFVLAGLGVFSDGASVGKFFGFLFLGVIFSVILLLGAVGIHSLFFATDEERRTSKEVSQRVKAQQQATSGVTPLRKWRGLAYMTRQATVKARCAACNRRWSLDGKAANTIADQQGLGNRMVRGGTKMEQFGATFTVGASGRRIAAGMESERQAGTLAWALSLAACPACHRIDNVSLTKP